MSRTQERGRQEAVGAGRRKVSIRVAFEHLCGCYVLSRSSMVSNIDIGSDFEKSYCILSIGRYQG